MESQIYRLTARQDIASLVNRDTRQRLSLTGQHHNGMENDLRNLTSGSKPIQGKNTDLY